MFREKKAPVSLPRCPICKSQAILLETISNGDKVATVEIMCEGEDHCIQIIMDTEAEAIETWKKAFTKPKKVK